MKKLLKYFYKIAPIHLQYTLEKVYNKGRNVIQKRGRCKIMPLTKPKALLIVNSKAGKQGAKNNFYTIVEELSKKYLLTVHLTEGPGDAAIVASEAADYPTVICCGGDGTVNQVVSGFLKAGISPDLGYLPSGTANDLAASFELSKDPQTAAAILMNGEPIPHDVGKLNNRYFVYIACFGAFTKVSYETPQDMKNIFGHFAYIMNGAAELLNLTPERVSVKWEGGEIKNEEVFFVGFMNTFSVGGLVKLPKDRIGLSDGKLEMILIKKPKNAAEMNALLMDLIKNRLTEGDNDNIVFVQSTHFELSTERAVSWTIDGEGTNEINNAIIDVLPRAVHFIRGGSAEAEKAN